MINEHPSVQALLERNARKTGPLPAPLALAAVISTFPLAQLMNTASGSYEQQHLPRGLGLMLGTIPRLKIALRLGATTIDAVQADRRGTGPALLRGQTDITCGSASRSSGDSLRLPCDTNGAVTLQSRSQKATTLSHFICLWPL